MIAAILIYLFVAFIWQRIQTKHTFSRPSMIYRNGFAFNYKILGTAEAIGRLYLVTIWEISSGHS